MKFFNTSAIVLKRTNFSDSDRIFSLLTPDLGKISAIAKGVRKIKSRKAGHLDLGNIVKVGLVEGKSMYVLTQAETIESCDFSFKDKEKIYAVLEALEVLNKLLPENQYSHFYYDLYLDFLKRLKEKNIDLAVIFTELYKKALNHSGFWSENEDKALIGIKSGADKLTFLRSYFEDCAESSLRSRVFRAVP